MRNNVANKTKINLNTDFEVLTSGIKDSITDLSPNFAHAFLTQDL
jgi:hypothetical protein